MRWADYHPMIFGVLRRYPRILVASWRVLGPGGMLQWANDYLRFTRGAIGAALARAGGPAGEQTLTGLADRVAPALGLRVRARYAEWRAMGWLDSTPSAVSAAVCAVVPMEIIIRPAAPADAPEIARLNEAFNDLRTSVEHIAAHLAERGQFERAFLAEVDGQVAGMACLRLLPCLCEPVPYAELTELFVDQAYRRLGVGRALIRHIEQEARAGGATQLVLLTSWRNTEAHGFYHTIGYRLYTVTMRRELG
jgi:GNAT superfamily N-acetyltransferase